MPRTLLFLLDDAEDATMRTVVEVPAEIIFIIYIYVFARVRNMKRERES
jgi:hypothetical protein